MSIGQTLKSAGEHVPAAYLIGWAAGIDWSQTAGFLACLWTLWMMADKGVAKFRHWRMLREIREGEARRDGRE